MAAVYSKMANQHAHPDGPWPIMLKEVQKVVKEGGRILDVASGMGEPALTIAKALPSVTVMSTDFSEEMVVKAEAVCADVPNMTAQFMDAQEMVGVEDGSIDIVTCCYGYMFPDDKVKALQETRRVLKDGGVLIATTWDKVRGGRGAKRRAEGCWLCRKAAYCFCCHSPPHHQSSPQVDILNISRDIMTEVLGQPPPPLLSTPWL